MVIRLFADKVMSQFSQNEELIVETSRKAPAPHEGAAALATSSLTTLKLVSHEPPPTYQPPVLHSPGLNELIMNKKASPNVLCSRKSEAQRFRAILVRTCYCTNIFPFLQVPSSSPPVLREDKNTSS